MQPSIQLAGPICRIPPLALLDLKRLAMLREVDRRGSFAAAAKAMSFTPSAVSQQMAALGRELGVALFERTPHGMHLTESAQALVAHTEAVFARLAEAQAEIEAIAGGVGGRLRLGSFPTATVSFAARAMQNFRELCPGVQLAFADGEPYESVARLKERELDLAVLFDFDHWTAATDYDGRAVCDDCEIECLALFDDHFRVVLPAGHPLARFEFIEIAQLEGERVIGSPATCSPWGSDLQHLCRIEQVTPEFEPHYRTVDFAALQAIVATGRGLTLVPELALSTPHPDTISRPLVGGPVRHVSIATLAGIDPSPACQVMTDVIVELTAARMRHQVPALAVSAAG